MNKFECMCAHINCGNGEVSGWKSVEYVYPGNGEVLLTVTYTDDDKRTFKFVSMRAATKFVTINFKWKSKKAA